MKIERFEDLNAWIEARKLYKMVICSTGQALEKRDLIYVSQVRGAALSVMANIAKGFESLSTK